MDPDIISTLIKAAQFSDILNKHSAALIKNNKIYAIAINDIVKTVEFINHSGRLNCRKITRHAEENVFFKTKIKNVKNLDIIVIRINSKLELRNSKPCVHCLEKLKKYNIRKVYYSTQEGGLHSDYLSNITKDHISSGQKLDCYR